MARKKKVLEDEALKKEAMHVNFDSLDLDDAFDALDQDMPVIKNDLHVENDDEDDEGFEISERLRGSPAFISLQQELSDIREARKKLSMDMEEPELDRDERDTLKARGTLLDSRERSAREELKLFHKHELTNLGQIRKVRIVIEDLLDGSGRSYEGAV